MVASDRNAPAKSSAVIDPLTRLAIKYGTDKWGPHFYTPIYDALFSSWRNKPIRLLEIGVGGYQLKTVGGASLAMWAEYFPNGKITGIDNAEKELNLGPKISIEKGCQADNCFLAHVSKVHGPFDIIIDDGSHAPQDVEASFFTLFPLMTSIGFYVVEDVQTCFMPDFGGSPSDGSATLQLALFILKSLNFAEIRTVDPTSPISPIAKQVRSFRAYHNLLIIEKGDNSEPSSFSFEPRNPHAAHALRTIKEELNHAPTAEGWANLVELYLICRQFHEARSLVLQGLEKWSSNSTLLASAYNIALASNNVEEQVQYLELLSKNEPSFALPLLEKTKGDKK